MSFLTDKKFLQIANIITYIGILFMNFLSGTSLLGGLTLDEISDKYSNLFSPSGVTFAIWGLIYLFLGCFVIYIGRDLWKDQKENIPYVEQVSFYFIISGGLNIGWLLSWHYDLIPLSQVIMVFYLLILIRIYTRLNIALENISTREKLLVHVPFSLNLGWISIATIANFAVLFKAVGWDGLGIPEPVWVIIVLLVALMVTLLVQYTRRDIVYSLVVAWALFGIILKRLNPSSYENPLVNLGILFQPIYYEIIMIAIIGEIIVIIGIVFILFQNLKKT